jgi:hypothetical protein
MVVACVIICALLKRVLRENKHEYFKNFYYSVISRDVNGCPHLSFWVPSAFSERSVATAFLLLDKNVLSLRTSSS